MNSTTFNDVLTRVKTLIETDSDLSAFCNDKWGRAPTAAIRFRSRREIGFNELPLVLITRPQVTGRKRVRHGREGVHTVRLYAGFVQNDPELGAAEQVAFEEKIEDALTRDNPFSDLALEAAVGDSVNDEGAQAPAYFTVMHVEVLFQRKT